MNKKIFELLEDADCGPVSESLESFDARLEQAVRDFNKLNKTDFDPKQSRLEYLEKAGYDD